VETAQASFFVPRWSDAAPLEGEAAARIADQCRPLHPTTRAVQSVIFYGRTPFEDARKRTVQTKEHLGSVLHE